MRISPLYAFVIIFGLLIASAQAGQSPTNSITGLISDRGRNPIAQLRVELRDELGSMLASTRTDAIGRFRFTGLSQGNFQVRVITVGTTYVEETVSVQLRYSRGTSGAHHEQIDIMLRTREEAKGPSNLNAGTTFVQQVPEKARKAYEHGTGLLNSGRDAGEGLSALLEAIEIFPDYYLALERLGAELVKYKEFEKARIALTKAVQVNPSGELSRYALGVAAYHLRLYPEAIENLRRALALAPNSPNAPLEHYYFGLAALKNNKQEEAETHFKRAVEMGAKQIPTDVHMHLAQIYSNRKLYQEAANELETFLKVTPDARDAESIRGLIQQLRAKENKGK